MSDHVWTMDASNGELLVHTEVAGRAARLGHRLTLAMTSWQASVSWADGRPTAAELTVDVDSLEVLHGSGGVKSLSGPEKVLARSNALGSLTAKTFPRITFSTNHIQSIVDDFSMTGMLTVRDRERPCTIDLHVADLGPSWRMSCSYTIRQSDFGVKPYSLMMGAIRVADDVTVSFSAERAKDD